MSDNLETDRVTMTTIARIAGVTQATVSRAFNHPDKLSTETLNKIMEAVRVTGYVPNLLAGALASKKSRMMAAIVPSITNVVYSSVLQPFIGRVRSHGYQTMVMESGLAEEEEERLVTLALARRPEGILLTGVSHSRECRRQLMVSGVPVVEIWDVTKNPIDVCVGFSHTDVARDAAFHLLSKGYKRLAVVSAHDARAQRRRDAFCDAAVTAGSAPPLQFNVDGPASISFGRQALHDLISQGFSSGAVFCSSDILAHGVLIEGQAQGISVPETIGVLGFGDQDFAASLVPSLSSIGIDRQELGNRAADALVQAIAYKTRSETVINIGYKIVERGSLSNHGD